MKQKTCIYYVYNPQHSQTWSLSYSLHVIPAHIMVFIIVNESMKPSVNLTFYLHYKGRHKDHKVSLPHSLFAQIKTCIFPHFSTIKAAGTGQYSQLLSVCNVPEPGYETERSHVSNKIYQSSIDLMRAPNHNSHLQRAYNNNIFYFIRPLYYSPSQLIPASLHSTHLNINMLYALLLSV